MAKDQEDNGKELLRSMEEQLAMIEEDFRPEISDIESITPIFESEADRAKMRLFQQRQKMNNVLGDLLKTRENDTATLLINHPDFQYDPTRKLGDQNYIEYALNNNNDAVVMALLNQPFDVISTLLRHTDILESFLKCERETLVEPLLALPPKKIALILGHINKSHRIDTLENEPYNQFLKEASRIGIKPTILANRISHLIDEKSIHRLTFFAPLNSNINEYCRRGPENNIVPFRRTWMYQTKPLTFAILTGKWQQASILLKNKDIRLDVDKEVKHYVGPIGINVDLPKIIALIAKHNVLPPEALGFIAELEERMGATKPFVKQTKKSRSPRLKP